MLKRITKTVIVLAMLVVTPTWGQVHKANQSKGSTKSQMVKKDSRWEFKGDFYEGLARVRTPERKWGYVNKAGKIVIPVQFSFAGEAILTRQERWSFPVNGEMLGISLMEWHKSWIRIIVGESLTRQGTF